MQARDCRVKSDAAELAAQEWRMRIEQAQSVQELGRMIQIEARRRAAAGDGWSKSIPSPAFHAAGREVRE